MASYLKFYILVLISILHTGLIPYCTAADSKYFYLEKNEDENDLRANWYFKIVQLALSKTVDEYGPYEIRRLPHMTFSRQWQIVIENRYPNFLQMGVYTDKNLKHDAVEAIHFPIQLGLLGYRVCFHAKKPSSKITNAIAQDTLKNLSYGQGEGWSDVAILRYNGYKVLEVFPFESLFKMTAAGRFDLFCRGINEIYDEYHLRAKIEGLAVEQRFAFHYPYPVFIHLNKANQNAITRIRKGLYAAYKDGSFFELFHQHYGKRLAFIKLHQRKIIPLENPLIKTLDPAYKDYLYRIE